MINENYTIFVQDMLQWADLEFEMLDEDVVKIHDFFEYLKETVTNRKYDVVAMLEEKYGINGSNKIPMKIVAVNHDVNHKFAGVLVFELTKELKKKYRDFFEAIYKGESDWGFFYQEGDTPSRDVPINRLGLSTRAHNCLTWRNRLVTVGDLLSLPGGEKLLARFRNFGKKSLEEVRGMMQRCNLQFDEPIVDEVTNKETPPKTPKVVEVVEDDSQVISVEEFTRIWDKELRKMVRLFVNKITTKIHDVKGLQAPTGIEIESIIYTRPMKLSNEEQSSVYNSICKHCLDSGWKIKFCTRLDEVNAGLIRAGRVEFVNSKTYYVINIESNQLKKDEEDEV